MVFDFLSFNYKPKDFKKGDQDKSLQEILEMKPSKVGKDFFTKYANEIVEVGLREETLNAIQLLSDLRDKAHIYEKCYKGDRRSSQTRRAPQAQQAQQAPAPQAQQAPAPQAVEPMSVEEDLEEGDKRNLIPAQTGGRRTRRRKQSKSRKALHKKGNHTKCRHSGGAKTKRRRHRSRSRRSKH